MSIQEDVFLLIQQYLKEMQSINENLLVFIDDEANEETNYQELIKCLNQAKIGEYHLKLVEFLHLIVNIANNHHRKPLFYEKIDKILQFFLPKIRQFYTKEEIFNIFSSNNRLLLFFFKQNVIDFDNDNIIISKINHIKIFLNLTYFYKLEGNLLQKEKNSLFEIEKNDEHFNEYCLKGENSNQICQLIQNDSLDEFIHFINIQNISVNSQIPHSIFETNSFLQNKKVHLIEYAAFYGSFQILKYLFLSDAICSPFLWLYSIHGRNYEIIHFLEENNIDFPTAPFFESIKCHHNEITEYLLNLGLEEIDKKKLFITCLECFNFTEILNHFENVDPNYLLNLASKYDYCYIVELLLKIQDLDINKKLTVLLNYFEWCFKIEYFFEWNFKSIFNEFNFHQFFLNEISSIFF